MNRLADIIKMIKPLDEKAMSQAQSRQDTLTKPPGSLGRLEELSVQLAGIQGKVMPQVKDKVIIIMAGDHGVVAEKIGNWPQTITAQMVANFLRGGAGINVLARQIGTRITVVDMGVASNLKQDPCLLSRKISPGTWNMALGPAMTLEQAVRAVETGIEVMTAEVTRDLDIVGTGDMGIGNTTASSAICAAITGKPVAEVTGQGTGLDDSQLEHKIAVIEKALAVNHPDPAQPLDVLAKVGGFEIGGLAGVMLAAAAHRIPVVVDGFISGAAALIATALAPGLKDFIIPAHISTEAGHQALLKHLGLKPLLNLGLRLGEGTGAALGIFLVETAARMLAEMTTFAEAGVSEESK
ncbi:MAG: nicotinate-nucleotide--dimethylbenzimidazole phosphoribosyltransferase [Dehalococcoidales bacterium]|nr:nicotinate-nucleotide--dimethylbenzimidazole phosphoribosyltransferase [Dehalococcoidales bacterium]MDP6448978.1 nicotinate-nucleotide--dimethylbenzimidazole phosphoribosyltransferase [Dehalococcoidales bacterium]MDP6577477.1 nicotinate-nucleotide--dimethylbenzimidazole phosphoribosyltransferase [Dehalococcoidales bacterium]MDP6825012.1 nicotinate-nucleotide--dimethylbenzimidazole phosphoribosyltransferase [Dehalococcoidales bacterium]